MTTFYRRPLPAPSIAFGSPEGRGIFREALADGTLEGFFSLSEQFHTQSEPAYCGLSTLVVALNALAIDPGRAWKGPWRWYGEDLLDCCLPLEVVQKGGISFDELACLARCNGVEVEPRRPEQSSLQAFRAAVLEAARSPSEPILVVSYARSVLGQTGGGHFSPLAGYHSGRDLALVLDVARFKYPPHWVPLPLLWEALQPADPATGRPRGFLVLRRGRGFASVLCRLQVSPARWGEVLSWFSERWPEEVARRAPRSLDAVAAAFVSATRASVFDAISSEAVGGVLSEEHHRLLEETLAELRATPAFALIRSALPSGPGAGELTAELLTLLFLASPDETFASMPEPLRLGLARLRETASWSALLAAEVVRLRDQIKALIELGRCGIVAEAAERPP